MQCNDRDRHENKISIEYALIQSSQMYDVDTRQILFHFTLFHSM